MDESNASRLREVLARLIADGGEICPFELGWTQSREKSFGETLRRLAGSDPERIATRVAELVAEHDAVVAADTAEFAEARRVAHLRRSRNWRRCMGCGEIHDIRPGVSRCAECGPADVPVLRLSTSAVPA